MQQIQSQEHWVLYRLEKFYSDDANIERIQNILSGESKISLRLIDWFVTNYSKKYNISFVSKLGSHVVVYLAYKSHLKAYSKKMFDPFCRCKRIRFKNIDTTVGQLNFFEWAITDGVLDYLEEHKDDVQTDMETRCAETKESFGKKKRHELSESAAKFITKHDVITKIHFT